MPSPTELRQAASILERVAVEIGKAPEDCDFDPGFLRQRADDHERRTRISYLIRDMHGSFSEHNLISGMQEKVWEKIISTLAKGLIDRNWRRIDLDTKEETIDVASS